MRDSFPTKDRRSERTEKPLIFPFGSMSFPPPAPTVDKDPASSRPAGEAGFVRADACPDGLTLPSQSCDRSEKSFTFSHI